MRQGTVRYVNEKKRFGFVETSSGERFYLRSAVVDGHRLHEGDRVVFEARDSSVGGEAEEVRLATSA